MREYGKVAPSFWTGDTGKKLRGDSDAQVVALYLATGPHATMTGLYYLALPTLAHEIGRPLKGASEALRRVCEAGFASYDDQNEVVFVPEMARYQIAESLKPNDKRIIGIVREIEQFRKTRFYAEFYERYRVDFCLPEPRPFEAPCKPLRSQEQEQEQEQLQIAPAAREFDFEALYRNYPRKEGKSAGLKVCERDIKTPEQYKQLGQAIRIYAALMRSEGRIAKHVKGFGTFMNCWRDYLDTGTGYTPELAIVKRPAEWQPPESKAEPPSAEQLEALRKLVTK